MSPLMMRACLRADTPKTNTRRIITHQPPPEYTNLVTCVDGGISWVDSGDVCWPGEGWEGIHPHYKVGERVCLLATWAAPKCLDDRKPSEINPRGIAFWHEGMGDKPAWAGKSRPGRFLPDTMRHLMPTAEVVRVEAQRLQDISEADAIAEGIESKHYVASGRTLFANYDNADDFSIGFSSPIESYRSLWNSIYAKPQAVTGEGGEITHYVSYPWEPGEVRRVATHRGKPLHIDPNPWVWSYHFRLTGRGVQ